MSDPIQFYTRQKETISKAKLFGLTVQARVQQYSPTNAFLASTILIYNCKVRINDTLSTIIVIILVAPVTEI